MPAPPPAPLFLPAGPLVEGYATRYGLHYAGRPLGCGSGYYASEDATIIAVGPARYAEWPCGTRLEVCGTVGCFIGWRQDSCPGCSRYHVDLSEAGIALACGDQADFCYVTIQPLTIVLEVDVAVESEVPAGGGP